MRMKPTGKEQLNIMRHDPTDYDGMGNYGRFPASKNNLNKPTSKLFDILLIILALMLPVFYYFIK